MNLIDRPRKKEQGRFSQRYWNIYKESFMANKRDTPWDAANQKLRHKEERLAFLPFWLDKSKEGSFLHVYIIFRVSLKESEGAIYQRAGDTLREMKELFLGGGGGPEF